MISFLLASQNVAFSSALVLMIVLGLMQAVGLGGDHGIDLDSDADLDMDADGDLNLLGWLGVGRVPLMILLALFLAAFGVIGLIGQQVVANLTGVLASGWLAAPAAAIAALPVTGLGARGLARILPGDLTTAIDVEELVGRGAVIVTGRATQGSPARARAEDRFGQSHYFMVEPDNPGTAFEEGERVLLVRRQGDCFRAIARGDHHLPTLGV